MPDIHLLIFDNALREAVIEQIAATKIGHACPADIAHLAAVAGVIIVDDSAFDKKVADLCQKKEEKLTILVLGETEDAENIAETFAKPVRLGHLMTRIRYYIETAPLLRDRVIAFGSYRLEPHNRRIFYALSPEPIRLTEKETALLVFLADSKEPATRHDIMAGVWGYDERIDTHTLETHIYQLRRKLEETADLWLISEGGRYQLARGTR